MQFQMEPLDQIQNIDQNIWSRWRHQHPQNFTVIYLFVGLTFFSVTFASLERSSLPEKLISGGERVNFHSSH